MMEITLRLSDGQKKTFCEEELVAIVEEHFRNNKPKNAQVPIEGEWFMVNPLTIDQNLFKEKRNDKCQEITRQYILEAFEEIKKNPKYTRQFKTMFPEKTWDWKKVTEIKKLAQTLGDHNADQVEQALEWAQRIANGETWEDICNKNDTTNWYRLVTLSEGYYVWFVGGSCKSANHKDYSASHVEYYDYYHNFNICDVVPLVVSYE